MIVGHYAAALIPYSRLRGEAPFWLLLLCANIPEFLWLVLALAGVETATPHSLLDATFSNMKVEMLYSHNLVPALIQAAIVGVLVWLAFRKPQVAAWCAALVVVHVLCDYLVGFEHQLLGRDSPAVALNSYGRFPHAAILFELAFAMACVFAYHRLEARRGKEIPVNRRRALYAVIAVGILIWLPAATLPLRGMLP